MCGRFLLLTDTDRSEIESIIDEISEKYKNSALPHGEVFPTNSVPVIYSHNSRKILSAARWGFPNFKNNGVIINARSETLAEKPMFKKSFSAQRCIVPANGYFEWLTEGRKNTKYFIQPKGISLFYMAGLYNIFNDRSGNPYAALTIITVDANPDISFIHDRMPAILDDTSIATWLDGGITDLSTLQGLLLPAPAGEMDFKTA